MTISDRSGLQKESTLWVGPNRVPKGKYVQLNSNLLNFKDSQATSKLVLEKDSSGFKLSSFFRFCQHT